MSYNSNKSRFLGQSFGCAYHRLRKRILFSLVQETGKDICFRCSKKIETVDDLSIEHKKPWEGRSVDLFWDIANIAFSHLRCNRPHNQQDMQIPNRKVGPPGTAWCNVHQEYLRADRFYAYPKHWNGLSKRCKDCHNAMTNARKRRSRLA